MSPDISAFRSIEPRPIDLMLPTRTVQPRAGMDEDTVAEYAAAMERGDVFPPLLVVETPSEFLLIDGWHRREAAQRLGVDNLPARIVRGSEEVAVGWRRSATSSTASDAQPPIWPRSLRC
jgi:hypothetical protein